MKRVYRLFVEITIEGDRETLPYPDDVMFEVIDVLRERDLESRVLSIEHHDED